MKGITKLIALLTLSTTLLLPQCVSISGQLGFTDPSTGVSVGVRLGEGKAVKSTQPTRH